MLPHSVRSKTIAACAAVLLLAVATSPFWTILVIKRHAGLIVNDTMPGLISSSLAHVDMSEAFFETTKALWTTDPSVREASIVRIDEITKDTDSQLAAYAALIDDREDQLHYQQVLEKRGSYRQTRTQAFGLATAGKRDEALKLFGAVAIPQFQSYSTSLSELIGYNMTQAKARGGQIVDWCNFLLVTQGLLLVFFILYGFLVPYTLVIERIQSGGRGASEL